MQWLPTKPEPPVTRTVACDCMARELANPTPANAAGPTCYVARMMKVAIVLVIVGLNLGAFVLGRLLARRKRRKR